MKKLPENFQPNKNTNWDDISINYELPKSFIEKHFNKLNLRCISLYQRLPEDFIGKYIDKLDKSNISFYQKLSEDFIEKHFNKLDLYYIFRCQKLSESFIEKNIGKSYLKTLYFNENVSRKTRRKFGIEIDLIKSKRLFFRKKHLEI